MTRAEYIEAAGDLHGRAIPEWVGKNPDTPIPPRVSLRVLLRQSRRCAKSGRLIRAGDATQTDHIISLKRGGENRESNLQVILTEEHIEKTSAENSEDAKVERIQKKHYSLMTPKPRSPFKRKMNGEVVRR
jgi:5-methylcytosine-specific restriction endonuclease McrA